MPGDALFDKPASEIRIDEAALGSLNGLTQALVGYPSRRSTRGCPHVQRHWTP